MQETLVWFLGWKDPWRRDRLPTPVFLSFTGGSDSNAGDLGLIPGLASTPEEGRGNPLHSLGFPGDASGKESFCQCRRPKRLGFNPCVKIPLSRKWYPTPVFLPGKSHGQRNLVSYSPWGCKESDKTERLSTITHTIIFIRKLNKILEEIHRIQ